LKTPNKISEQEIKLMSHYLIDKPLYTRTGSGQLAPVISSPKMKLLLLIAAVVAAAAVTGPAAALVLPVQLSHPLLPPNPFQLYLQKALLARSKVDQQPNEASKLLLDKRRPLSASVLTQNATARACSSCVMIR
jgi:hypothetical protein